MNSSGNDAAGAAVALSALEEYAPDAKALHGALHFDGADGDVQSFAATIRSRVVDKLRREPVEDFRIDFEDGFGFRADEEEDFYAVAASNELAEAFKSGNVTCGEVARGCRALTASNSGSVNNDACTTRGSPSPMCSRLTRPH